MSFITTKPQEIGVKDLSPQEREEVLEFIYQCVMEKRIFVFSATPAGEKMFGEGVIVTSHYSVSEGGRAQVAESTQGDVEQVELIALY
ncbi:MAG TPA: hypothetical protein PKU87_04110 [Candidatus Atribacteria bacterium]|nr:hypothetical protein [Candidatus Atribacteria bacterium]